MASILAAGAGAAQGLESALMQLLRQQQMEEEIRSNKSREDISNRQLMETSRQHDLMADSNRVLRQGQLDSRDATLRNQERVALRGALDDLLPGVTITPEVRNRAVGAGAALPERFTEQVIPDDFVGPIQEGEPQRGEVASYLLNSSKAGNEQAPANAQLVTVTYKGKPVEAMFDPRGRTITYNGQDITAEAGHYERPRQEDRVLIQSGEGFVRRADAAKQLAEGQEVPLATSASTRSMQEGAQMLIRHVPEMEGLAAELDRRGMFGPVMSRIRQLSERLGTTGSPEELQASAEALGEAIANDPQLNNDELVGQFATTLGLMTSGMGRVHGGARGGGSIQMINYLKSLLSGASSFSMFKGRTRAVTSFLKDYAKGPGALNEGEQGATPAPGGRKIGRFEVVEEP